MDRDLPLQILKSLVQRLNHDIRTPLSVISNELYILQADGTDVDLSLSKIREIDQFLSGIETRLELQNKRVMTDIVGLTARVIEKCSLPVCVASEELQWNVDPVLFESLFLELFVILFRNGILQKDGEISFARGKLSIPLTTDESLVEAQSCLKGLSSLRKDTLNIAILDAAFARDEIAVELTIQPKAYLFLSQVKELK